MRQKPKRKRPVGRPPNRKVPKVMAAGVGCSRATAYRRLAAAKVAKAEATALDRLLSRTGARDPDLPEMAFVRWTLVTIKPDDVGHTFRVPSPRQPTEADLAKLRLSDILQLRRELTAEISRRYASRRPPMPEPPAMP